MKRKAGLLLVTLFLLCFFRAGSCRAEKSLTVLVYLCGSNLESNYGSATADLQEMAQAGIEESEISVLVMAGGSQQWINGTNPDENRIIEIGNGKQRVLEHRPWQNMGLAGTLTDFLNYGVQARPAERYALILWDHGGGPLEGVCWDEESGDHMTLDALCQGLESSCFADRKLAWIGFDACLMCTVEVADRVSPYAEYMIASQAEEPASGWNYAFLHDLHLDKSGAETGKRVADLYLETPQQGNPDLTMACVDLSRVAAVESCMNDFYTGIASQLSRETFSALSNLRFQATGFGKSAPTQGSGSYDLVDLVSLSGCYASLNPEGASAIQEAVCEAVVWQRSNLPDCWGLSVYHPFRNQEKFAESWREQYARLINAPAYAEYVNAYGSIMSGEHLVLWNHLDQLYWDAGTVTCLLNQEQAENLASARLLILGMDIYDAVDRPFFRVYETADVRWKTQQNGTLLLMADYHGAALQAVEKSSLLPMTGALSYQVTEEGTYLVSFYPSREGEALPENPVVGEYTLNSGTGELELKSYAVYDEVMERWSRRAEIDTDDYDGLVFRNDYRNRTVNALGEIPAFDTWPEDEHTVLHMRHPVDTTDIRLTFATDLIAGEYLVAAFELTDTQGNTYMTDLTEISQSGITYYEVDAYFPDDTVSQKSTMVLTQDAVYFMLELENHSEVMENYWLSRLEINGLPAESGIRQDFLDVSEEESLTEIAPGHTGTMIIAFDREALESSDSEHLIRTVSGTYWVSSKQKEDHHQILSFYAEPMLSIDLAEGEEFQKETLELKQPASKNSRLLWNQHALLREIMSIDGSSNAMLTLHLQMTNLSEDELFFAAEVLTLNGKTVEAASSINQEGSGDRERESTRQTRGLIQGEQRSVILTLTSREIEAIAPDVALKECVLHMVIFQTGEDGELELLDSFPLRLNMNIPLTAFYPDAISLPSEIYEGELILPLFSDQGISLDCRNVYYGKQQILLELNAENQSDVSRTVFLDHALAAEQHAEIGTNCNLKVYVLNTQRQALGIGGEWPVEPYAQMRLSPGESRRWYVSMYTFEEGFSFEDTDICFDVLIVPDEGEMRTGNVSYSLKEWSSARPGEGNPLPMDQHLLADSVVINENIQHRNRILSLTAEQDSSPLDWAGYMVFRRLDTQEAFVRRNYLLKDELENKAWLLPISYGVMTLSEDRMSAGFEFPNLQLMIGSGEGAMEIPAVYLTREADGNDQFYANASIYFLTENDEILPQHLHQPTVCRDPADGAAMLLQCLGADEMNADWARMMLQFTPMMPADTEPKELFAFVRDIHSEEEPEGVKVTQLQYIDQQEIHLSLSPLEEAENCFVLFCWHTEDGKIGCSELYPLLSFPENAEAGE